LEIWSAPEKPEPLGKLPGFSPPTSLALLWIPVAQAADEQSFAPTMGHTFSQASFS
jgi:hypothetical protein